MKFIISTFILIISFALFAGNEINYERKIVNAQTNAEKEKHYLSWISYLSQSNTLACDSVIKQRSNYISQLSDKGKIALLVTQFNNTRLGGTKNTFDIIGQELQKEDLLLVEGIIKCLKKETISEEEYAKIKGNIEHYKDATRKSVFYAISTCKANIDEQSIIDFFNLSIKYAKQSDVKSLASSIHDIASLFYLEIEDFQKAIQNQQKGISFAKENKLSANTVSHLVSIGHIHFELGQFDKAEEAFLEAQELLKGLNIDYVSGQLYNYLGELYNAKKELSKSIQYYQKSLINFYNIQYNTGLVNVHKNIGKAYFDKGDIDLAAKNYELSLQFSAITTGDEEKGELYCLISQLHLSKNQLQQSEVYIKKAINYWQNKNLVLPLHKAYFKYAEIKYKQGNHKEANLYYRQYIKMSDSIYSQETDRKVAELSELFKTEQKERKIIEQEKKLEEELSERLLIQNKLTYSKKLNQLILAILLVSIGLFVAIFVLIKNKNKQEQLKKKQREIELQQTLLRSQMNPHFIFNAMSVIQSYIYDEDIKNSSKFLVHFSKLMRLMLENNAKEFISLEKEIEIINRYLVIQKMRFEDRFDFTIESDSIEDQARVFIPPMLVQPFIENAIEHGALDKVNNGLIRIKYEIVGNLFKFIIEDNGVGRKASSKKKKSADSENHRSMAIDLTKGRISLLNEKHKSKGYLRIEDLNQEKETGTLVTITTPFKINY
ncbi:tetratricopeptide repeat-containing sensor histidine kinase [Brumimicrobium oceani]|uniref:Signal transduction histidine kinase internal region domain-containing protein n=1 Tax=Brumimicrobium oceani TaxID=2100725 RepID=A0A2U2XBY5_9FLAO|nr:histidine kinase [Brumimicrobium oceani]PWH85273.1 hypothetical protein DIT68_10060 [Brumimicrobium oceani]